MPKEYGHFAKEGKEYVITEPRTPRHWYNYLWNDNYITFTSQVGYGEGFAQDSMGRRVYNVCNRNVYLIDTENNEFWTANGLPINRGYQNYKCIHGLGYTYINLEFKDIETSYRIFVPENEKCEIWTVRIKNNSSKTRKIKVIPYVKTAIEGFYRPQAYDMGAASFHGDLNAIVGRHYVAFESDSTILTYGYMMGNEAVTGYDGRNDAFVGPYSDDSTPEAVVNGGCTNSEAYAEKTCYVLEAAIELESGEERVLDFVVGVTQDEKEMFELKNKFLSPRGVQKEFEKTVAKLAKDIENVVVNTPDEGLNLLFNGFLKHQTSMGSRWARVRHNGFRDTNCDCECLGIVNPQLAWERAKRIISYQYSNGFAPRTFLDGKVYDRNYADNTVWITFNIYHLLKEIGDLKILDEIVPFNDGTQASVYDHLKRSVNYLWNDRGELGLVKIWGGDWNDCLNGAGLKGKGMSVWLSIAWYLANKQFAEIARMKGEIADAELAEIRGSQMKDIVDKYAWDGEYYLVAYNDEGKKLGSKECDEGKIHLIPQAWAVISGICKEGKVEACMDAVEKYLTFDLGVAMAYPPYTYKREDIGNTTEKLPGVHENGGIYQHSYTWKTAADCIMKRNEKVQEDLEKMLPANHKWVEKQCEPYITCNSYFPKEAGYRYAKPGQTWRTGTGAWLLKDIAFYVLGLQPEMKGLRLNPCLPPDWKQCSVKKVFRGATYHISYEQMQEGGCNRIAKMLVNGKEHSSDILPYEKNGIFEVKVFLEK